jgi:transposase
MKLHGNAALSWSGRRLLAERVLVEGWTLAAAAAAAAAGVSVRCARKWVGRYRCEGEPGLLDRSSAPRRVANRTRADRVAAIVALRRLRVSAAEIAEILSMPLSTVSAVLTRNGIGRLGRIGLEPAVRYERAKPGELVHIDVKKLGRIEGGAGHRVLRRHYTPRLIDRAGRRRGTTGSEYVHVAVDDYSRLAYAEVLADEKAATAAAFLRRALAYYRRHGIRVERILTDMAQQPSTPTRSTQPPTPDQQNQPAWVLHLDALNEAVADKSNKTKAHRCVTGVTWAAGGFALWLPPLAALIGPVASIGNTVVNASTARARSVPTAYRVLSCSRKRSEHSPMRSPATEPLSACAMIRIGNARA